MQAESSTFFYGVWGWEQTNIDFYVVVKETEKSVWLQPVKSKIVENQPACWSELVAPKIPAEPNGFNALFNNSVKPKRFKKYDYKGETFVKITQFCHAYKWDGKPQLATHGA